MGNLAGLGAFAQNLAGGIQQGMQNYATLRIKGQEMEQEKQKSKLQIEHMNMVNDANLFETALKVVEKSQDLPATQAYLDKIQFKTPFYKDTLSTLAIADADMKKQLIDFSKDVSKLITTPSSDVFSKVDLKVAEAAALFGTDSNTYKSLKATADISKEAYHRDNQQKLVSTIHAGMPLIEKIKKNNEAGVGGLTQPKPTLTDEEMKIASDTQMAKDQLMTMYPETYKILQKEYGWDKAEEGKINEWTLRERAVKGDITAKSILEQKHGEAVELKKITKPFQVNIGVTKATQTDLEKQQIDAEQNIMSFDEIEKLTKPEFLTYQGQGTALAQKYADKLNLGTSTKFLQKRTAWMQQAKGAFLAYRKWVTGVAGGEKEMAEIAKSFPDPDKNSPAEFLANLKQARTWRKKINNWVQHTRGQGLSISETPENLKVTKQKVGTKQGLQDIPTEELIEMLQEAQ